MKPIARIAIRRHGVGDWRVDSEPNHSKLEINLFRIVGGDCEQALKTLRKALASTDLRPIVALTFEGLAEIATCHLDVCRAVMSDCSSRNVEVALCAIGQADSAATLKLPPDLRPRETFSSVADLVSRLSGQPGANGLAPAPKKSAPRRRRELVAN